MAFLMPRGCANSLCAPCGPTAMTCCTWRAGCISRDTGSPRSINRSCSTMSATNSISCPNPRPPPSITVSACCTLSIVSTTDARFLAARPIFIAAIRRDRLSAMAGRITAAPPLCGCGSHVTWWSLFPLTRDHHVTWLPQPQSGGDAVMRPAIAERRSRRIASMKMGLAARNLASVVETIERVQHAETVIDGGGRGLGQLIELVADIVEQERLIDLGEPVSREMQPARQVQQVIAVGPQGAQRELAQPLGIKKAIGPDEFTAFSVEQPIGRGARRCRAAENELKSHGDSASSRQRIKSPRLAPARKKLLGSWPAGRRTIRAVRPARCKRSARARAAC